MNEAHSKYCLSNTIEDHTYYKSTRNQYYSMIREKKSLFYLTKLPKDFKSSKKFFQFCSSSIATKQNKNSISKIDCIISDDQVIDSEADIANIFNNHFTSLRSEYKYSIEECNGFINTNFKANRNLMPIHSLNGSFNFRFVSEELIKKTLDSLDNTSSPGVSLLPVRMLKEIHC